MHRVGASVKLPLLLKNNGSTSLWTTNFSVQNAGSSDARVTVTYTDACGALAPVTIKAGASHKFDQGAEACHSSPIFGATVTSSNPLVAVVLQEVPCAAPSAHGLDWHQWQY